MKQMHTLVIPNARRDEGIKWSYNNGLTNSPDEGGDDFNILLSNNGNASQTHCAAKWENNARLQAIWDADQTNPFRHPESLLDPSDPHYMSEPQLRSFWNSATSVDQELVDDHPVGSANKFRATQGGRGFELYTGDEVSATGHPGQGGGNPHN